jgi:hypothetical protein
VAGPPASCGVARVGEPPTDLGALVGVLTEERDEPAGPAELNADLPCIHRCVRGTM